MSLARQMWSPWSFDLYVVILERESNKHGCLLVGFHSRGMDMELLIKACVRLRATLKLDVVGLSC
uniref:Uncharacterized protein n=1 Tax=Lepeophtheirus salmonis TaxID=72036 RepID=A0A0K2T138_LEPSM